MTKTAVEKTYIEWDYELMEATEFRRIGECNRCGECCQGHIAFRVCHLDNDNSELDNKDGGSTTREDGVWSEIATGEQRAFFGIKVRRIDGHGCNSLIGRDDVMQDETGNDLLAPSGCAIYEDRPGICKEWPISPADVVAYPSCSYSFEEIQHWKIEPEDED